MVSFLTTADKAKMRSFQQEQQQGLLGLGVDGQRAGYGGTLGAAEHAVAMQESRASSLVCRKGTKWGFAAVMAAKMHCVVFLSVACLRSTNFCR